MESAYRAIEEEAAQTCAQLKCPNPYLALESLTRPHEAWWLNAFTDEADTTRVVRAYAANRPLMGALESITRRKEPLVGTPIQGYAVYRADLSLGQEWSVRGVRFFAITMARKAQPVRAVVWQAADSTFYIFRPARTQEQAEALAEEYGARIFVVRPNWSMPAPEWRAADPEFWARAPATPRGIDLHNARNRPGASQGCLTRICS